jgi:hypothetical protein
MSQNFSPVEAARLNLEHARLELASAQQVARLARDAWALDPDKGANERGLDRSEAIARRRLDKVSLREQQLAQAEAAARATKAAALRAQVDSLAPGATRAALCSLLAERVLGPYAAAIQACLQVRSLLAASGEEHARAVREYHAARSALIALGEDAPQDVAADPLSLGEASRWTIQWGGLALPPEEAREVSRNSAEANRQLLLELASLSTT